MNGILLSSGNSFASLFSLVFHIISFHPAPLVMNLGFGFLRFFYITNVGAGLENESMKVKVKKNP